MQANHEGTIQAIKTARKAIGFAAMGALPSPSVIKTTLTKIERELAPAVLADTRALLVNIQENPVLPSEKRCKVAMDEIEKTLNIIRMQMAEQNAEELNDTDSSSPSM